MKAAPENLDEEIFHNWWHANRFYHQDDIKAAHAMYRRLRAEHGIELFYAVQLKVPTRFVHPLGSVLGRAEYARHLVVYQGVSVGSTVDKERPRFTGPCVLFPHSGVIGPVTVGSNVWISAGTIVEAKPGKPVVIPDNVIVAKAGGIINNFDVWSMWRTIPTTRSVIDTFFSGQPSAPNPHTSEP